VHDALDRDQRGEANLLRPLERGVLELQRLTIQEAMDRARGAASRSHGVNEQRGTAPDVSTAEDVRDIRLQRLIVGDDRVPLRHLQSALFQVVGVPVAQRLLADGRDHDVDVHQGLGTFLGYRATAPGCVGLAELHLDELDLDQLAVLVPDQARRSGEQVILHALFLGGVDLDPVRGHLVARPAVQEDRLLGAHAERGARGIHGGVAAADDDDALAGQIDVDPELALLQELGALPDAVQVLTLAAQRRVIPRAHGEQDGVVVLLEVGDRVVLAERLVADDVHAEVEDLLDLEVEHLLGQAVLRDAVAQHAAQLGFRVEDGGGVAESPQVIRRREPAGPATDDGDLLAGLGQDRGQLAVGQVHLPVRHEALQVVVVDRLVLDRRAPATVFARSGAHAPADEGQRVALLDDVDRLLVLALGGELDVGGDVDLGGAELLARRDALVVVLEVQQAIGERVELDHVVRTHFFATAAADAHVRVHHRIALGAHVQGVEIARLDARAKAQAAVLAEEVAAVHVRHRAAVEHPLVVVLLLGAVATGAVVVGHLGLDEAGFAPEDARHRARGVGAARHAGGRRRRAVHHSLGARAAAREAAAAAVGAGQHVLDLGDARVDLDEEDTSRHGEHDRGPEADAQHDECRYNHQIIPLKAKKEIASSPAVTSPMPVPWRGLGMRVISKRSRMPANRTRARPKPTADATEKTIVCKRSRSSWMLMIAVPSTAQLVVISGRKIPSDL